MGGKPVVITQEAADDILALGPPLAGKIADKIEQLSENPLLGRRLRGNLSDYSKLRLSDYRVVYREYPDRLVVIAVGPRRDSEVYSVALRRLATGIQEISRAHDVD